MKIIAHLKDRLGHLGHLSLADIPLVEYRVTHGAFCIEKHTGLGRFLWSITHLWHFYVDNLKERLIYRFGCADIETLRLNLGACPDFAFIRPHDRGVN